MATPSSSTFSIGASSSSSSSNAKIGPRAKCDQVVYETIAKAAEIVVRGRCHVENNSNNSANNSDQNNGGVNGSGGSGSRNSNRGGNGGGGVGTSVSRFHLEVDEVDLVR